jgi:glucoamylase
MKMLFAQRASTSLALACSVPFVCMSCGYAGISDGWQDINFNKKMTAYYPEVKNGNIALTGEVDLNTSGGNFILTLAFGENPDEAGLQAKAALLQGFDDILNNYVNEWKLFQSKCYKLGEIRSSELDYYYVSTAVLKTHESKSFQGAMIASLSIPWGETQGDNNIGGYHLVWPRDLVESAGGLLAAGNGEEARRALFYLMCTQDADGHWPQNMWLDGRPYWSGLQMDETAFPILLAAALKRTGELKEIDAWPMVLKAASFLVRNGPVTQQDRWEEEPGYSPFTLAVEVSALLNAADFAEDTKDADVAKFLREMADIWNEGIERWTYIQDTELSRAVGVDGYYVRIAPPDIASANSPARGFVPIKNRPPGTILAPATKIISVDALALVRFGLRSPHDPRIINTLKVIDSVLKTETSTGPVWHRYNHDSYGEHADGSPYDGKGIGRGWPLLVGERAHYELAAGNSSEARRLLKVIEAQMSPGGFIPEQIWDAEDKPRKGLMNGKPSGSAMPLVWAHAEYIKLLRSLQDGKIFDMPIKSAQRHREKNLLSPFSSWRFNNKSRFILEGKILRIEVLTKALVHWSDDDWQNIHDQETLDSRLGVYYADLPTNKLYAGSKVVFTFFWFEVSRWEGTNFEIEIAHK